MASRRSLLPSESPLPGDRQIGTGELSSSFGEKRDVLGAAVGSQSSGRYPYPLAQAARFGFISRNGASRSLQMVGAQRWRLPVH